MSGLSKILFILLLLGTAFEIPVTHSFSGQNASVGDRRIADPNDSKLLETGQANKATHRLPLTAEFKVVSYNIRYRAGDDLKKLVELLRSDPEIGEAVVLGLQEVDRNKKRTKNQNTVKLLAEELGMHYAWAAPPPAKPTQEEETGVALLSPFPLTEVKRLVLPHDGPGGRRRAGIGATVKIGETSLRVYSIHSEVRMSMNKKVAQMKAALDDLATYPADMPAIVMGDFNTWEADAGERTVKLFKGAGFHTPFDGDFTFCQQLLFVPLMLKLDWIWLRHIDAKAHGIDRKVKLSDHWPLWTKVSIKRSATAASTAVTMSARNSMW